MRKRQRVMARYGLAVLSVWFAGWIAALVGRLF